MPDALLRPLGPEDRRAVLELYEEVRAGYPFPLGADWTPERIKKELVAAEGWGLFREGVLHAFVLYRLSAQVREITLLASRLSRHGQGTMTDLLRGLFQRVPGTFWLEVHVDNEPALKLYRALGFREQGRRRGYYRDGKDALLFEYQS